MKRPVVLGALALILALAVFAWRQDGDDDGPLNAIAVAAEKTQDEPGARATMRTVSTSPERSEPLTISGEMVFNDETERSRGVLTFRSPESGELEQLRTVTDGLVMYMSMEAFGLPDGKEWMKLDLSVGGDPELPLPSTGDPQEELQLLQEAIGARKLGEEDVRGVPTTHYRGKVEEDDSPLVVEVWIDADGLIRRMRYLSSRDEGGEQPEVTDMRIDFFAFGITPEIDVPDEDEVFDATPMFRAELEKAGEG